MHKKIVSLNTPHQPKFSHYLGKKRHRKIPTYRKFRSRGIKKPTYKHRRSVRARLRQLRRSLTPRRHHTKSHAAATCGILTSPQTHTHKSHALLRLLYNPTSTARNSHRHISKPYTHRVVTTLLKSNHYTEREKWRLFATMMAQYKYYHNGVSYRAAQIFSEAILDVPNISEKLVFYCLFSLTSEYKKVAHLIDINTTLSDREKTLMLHILVNQQVHTSVGYRDG